MEIMFNKVFLYSLALALLLSNSGMQLMACVSAPRQQACHHLTCKHEHGGAAPTRRPAKDSTEPMTCLQACSTGSLSLPSQKKVQFSHPGVSLLGPVALAHVFIPSSEPRSIFHPPA